MKRLLEAGWVTEKGWWYDPLTNNADRLADAVKVQKFRDNGPHVHDLEPQLVCESCGHRECLPAGSVVVSPEVVKEIERLRDEADDEYVPPHEFAVVEAYNRVLSLLSGGAQ